MPLDEPLRARILSCPTLPSLPSIAVDLLHLVERQEGDLGKFAHLLSRDPALAARVLKIANSAAYGSRGAHSVQRAVVLLGTRAVLAVSLSFTLVRNRRRGEAGAFDHEAFWRRAVYSAIAAKALAERWHVDPEEAFLGGLLQDIGVLALAEVMRVDYGALWKASAGDHDDLSARERAAWGSSHDELGHALLASWRLPDVFLDAVRQSHGLQPGRPAQPGVAACVHLSGLLAEVWLQANPSTAARRALDAARSTFGLEPDWVALALARAATLIPEVAGDLQLRLLSPERCEEILARATTALAAASLPAPAAARPAPALVASRELPAAVQRALSAGGPVSVLSCRLRSAAPAGPAPAVRDTAAEAFLGTIRGGDLLCRDPDGRFVFSLPGAGEVGAGLVAARLRRALEQALGSAPGHHEPGLWLEVGAVAHEQGPPPEAASLLAEALRRMVSASRERPEAAAEPAAQPRPITARTPPRPEPPPRERAVAGRSR